MTPKADSLPRIISEVERSLAEFYAFEPGSEAASHLVSKDELKASLGRDVEALPEFQARAGVFLKNERDDDLFIGIHLDESIKTRLETADPTRRLDDGNLDAFCVLVEEISHFHLILNRALDRRSVTKLELEWQGEIDKLLVCAITLKAQAGDSHVEPLARRLYDSAAIVAADRDLYWEATRHAARFWRSPDRQREPLGAAVRALLRRSYRSTWREKLECIEEPRKAS